jgi:hypothetical protein
MAPLKSTRIAWSVAVAALALWATSAPQTWGQVVATADRFIQTAADDTTTITTTVTSTTSDTQSPAATDCPTPDTAAQAPAPSAPASGQSATFHLCGADAGTAHAIEQLIAGRPFSANLSAQGDGCADLLVRVTSSSLNSGTATSNMSVALGGGKNLSIQIVTDNGTTHVNIT